MGDVLYLCLFEVALARGLGPVEVGRLCGNVERFCALILVRGGWRMYGFLVKLLVCMIVGVIDR